MSEGTAKKEVPEPQEPAKGKEKPAEPTGPKQAYSFRDFNVLIVEDYQFMAELLSSMLREFGVGRIMLAESAKEAREMLIMCNAEAVSNKKIDLVITDWLMPGGQDGVDLIKWMRGYIKDSIKFLPVIMCSAYTSEAVVMAGRDNGANEVLVKPVSAENLANRILHVVDNPRPFVKTPDFFGPDRRRQDKKFPGDDKRKMTESDLKVFHEKDK